MHLANQLFDAYQVMILINAKGRGRTERRNQLFDAYQVTISSGVTEARSRAGTRGQGCQRVPQIAASQAWGYTI